MTKIEYIEATLERLEYLGYPELILDFEPTQVAQAMNSMMKILYEIGVSPRLCALTIFGLTMHYQVVPRYKNETKH